MDPPGAHLRHALPAHRALLPTALHTSCVNTNELSYGRGTGLGLFIYEVLSSRGGLGLTVFLGSCEGGGARLTVCQVPPAGERGCVIDARRNHRRRRLRCCSAQAPGATRSTELREHVHAARRRRAAPVHACDAAPLPGPGTSARHGEVHASASLTQEIEKPGRGTRKTFFVSGVARTARLVAVQHDPGRHARSDTEGELQVPSTAPHS